jgi:hypothetical protein
MIVSGWLVSQWPTPSRERPSFVFPTLPQEDSALTVRDQGAGNGTAWRVDCAAAVGSALARQQAVVGTVTQPL